MALISSVRRVQVYSESVCQVPNFAEAVICTPLSTTTN